MASTPNYWLNRRMGRAVHNSAAVTDKTGATTTNIVDILTGAAAGTEVTEITVKATGDPADSIVLIFVHNGTDYRLIDEFDIGNPAPGSTTAAGYTETRFYTGLFLPAATWKLASGITVATTAGDINVWASGGDLS